MSNLRELISEERVVELTKTLVAIPSVTGQEDELADWVHGFLQSLGLRGVQRLAVPDAGDSVIGWLEGNADGPTMMLNFHLDTFDVFAGWESDPFEPVVRNGRLYGLGAHDMKGGAACVLAAVEALVKSGVGLNGRLLIAATSERRKLVTRCSRAHPNGPAGEVPMLPCPGAFRAGHNHCWPAWPARLPTYLLRQNCPCRLWGWHQRRAHHRPHLCALRSRSVGLIK